MLTYENLAVGTGHELVRAFRDDDAGLVAVIAVHSTALGPSMGGVRRRAYVTFEDALNDVLRLSAAMTLKNSAAGLPLGGGKSVIVDVGDEPTDALIDAFADAVDTLDGRYITAEDIGTTPRHMDRIAERTRWVAGQSPEAGGNGDPSPSTAITVFGALRAAANARWGAEDLAGRTVGVLGLGKVGGRLARLAAEAGARLVVADALPGRAEGLAAELPDTEAVAPEVLPTLTLDVLAPCATGGVLTPQLADALDVKVVCGAANNILRTDAVADRLAERGILYVPDFIANAGGVIQVGGAFLGWDEADIGSCLDAAIERTREVLAEAGRRGTTPLAIAHERAAARLRQSTGEAVAGTGA